MHSESTKRCTGCGAEKPLTEFYDRPDRPTSKDGKLSRCKPCLSEYMAEQRAKHRDRRLVEKRLYYQANKAAHFERGRRYRASHADDIRLQKQRWRDENRDRYRAGQRRSLARVRRRVLDHYSDGAPSCACCGEHRVPFLALDHTNGGGNEHRRQIGLQAGTAFYRWVIRNDFPPIFRVLCHNCNSARGYYGACPHESER